MSSCSSELAVAAHGLPRATGDIDLWIKRSRDNAQRVWRAVNKFGAPLSDLTVEDLSKRGTVIQLGVTPRRIDILTEITGVDFQEAQMGQLLVNVEGLEIPVNWTISLDSKQESIGKTSGQR